MNTEAQLRRIEERLRGKMRTPTQPGRPPEPVAIIGLAGFLPGCMSVREFWRALDEDHCQIDEIPADRFDRRTVHNPSRANSNENQSQWGGFIPDVYGFDPAFFKISKEEAGEMDPQQRLLLMAVYHALEDAGYAPESLRKSRTGVFIAGEESDYLALRREREKSFGAGVDDSLPRIANAVSHFFDFRGPSEFVNTLCSGGAIALNRAVRSLRSGEADAAVVGAVNLLLHPAPFAQMSEMDLLSPVREVHSFGRLARGHHRADGVAAVLLKPLSRAVADGDIIHAVIRHAEVNHNGHRAASRVAPDPDAHAEVIQACCEAAGLDPRRLGYIEAQGMGNPLSDIAEWRAFNQALTGMARARGIALSPGSCVVSCLKPLIGHMEAASSFGALFKIIHSLKARTIFGIHGFTEPHPELNREDQPCSLATRSLLWPENGSPRVAGLHSHGMGGNNAHILLEEYIDAPVDPEADPGPALVVLSAQSEGKLAEVTRNLLTWIQGGGVGRLHDLAHTLQVGRDAMPCRLAIVVGSLEALQGALSWHIAPEGPAPAFLCAGVAQGANPGPPPIGGLEARARYWVSGGMIPWRNVFHGRDARRISLPGYPFEKHSCRIEDKPTPPLALRSGDSPRDELRERLRSILAEELGMPEKDIDPAKHFLEYGLTSLAGLRLVRRLGGLMGAPLRLRDWLEHPNVELLSGFLASRINGASYNGALTKPGPTTAPIGREFPLSECQRGLWAWQKTHPKSSAYNVPLCLRVSRRIDADKFRQASQFALEAHPLLACSIVPKEGRLVHVPTGANVHLEVSEIGPAEAPRLQAWLENRLREPFILENGPLVRFYLIHGPGSESLVFLVLHHLVVDGLSSAPLLTTLLDAYLALCRGERPQFAPPAVDFGTFLDWERNSLSTDSTPQLEAYWKQQLAGAPPALSLMANRPAMAERGGGGVIRAPLTGELCEALKGLAMSCHTSLPVVFLGLFNVLLHRYSGEEDLVVGVVAQVRPDERFDRLVGYFINLLPIRTKGLAGRTFSDLIASLQEVLADGIDHAAFPFPLMVRSLGLAPTEESSPIVQIGFEYQSYVAGADLPKRYQASLPLSHIEAPRQTGEFELTLEIVEAASGIDAYFKFNPAAYSPETVARMAAHYVSLATEATASPFSNLADYRMLGATESRQLLADWNLTFRDYPRDLCAHEVIERQVRAHPDAIAISFEERAMTYGELDHRASILAAHLQKLGVRPDQPVAVCVERSPEMIVALLGILKAGGAYLPLDPLYPQERLAFIISDSHAGLIVTESRLTPLVRSWKTAAGNGSLQTVVEIDTHWAAIEKGATGQSLQRAVKPENLAYLIYTSGSTGNPKGVMIPHRALVNFLCSMAHEPGLRREDRLLAVTTLSFDIAGLELFLPLAQGAECRLCPSSSAGDPEQLRHLINRTRPTVMQATPSTWKMLFRAGWRNEERVRIFCGGEALPEELAATFIARGMEAWNLYGPTETTIWSTVQRVQQGASIGIGHPIANTRVYILDAKGRPVPMGVAGELWIAGDGLARGYWNRPELTAAKFVDLAFAGGERSYNTGDLACWREGGTIKFLGRRDHQVKLRGHRIELEEIENALHRHPLVRDSAVVVRQHLETRQLIAYYTVKDLGDKPAPGHAAELEAHLKRTLPAYMIPAFFILLPEMPQTPNGKKDRQSLAERNIEFRPREEGAAPRTKLEDRVLEIWRSVLGVEDIGPTDPFFQAGGDSVSAVFLSERIAQTFEVRFTTTDLFRHPTARAVSNRITSLQSPTELPGHDHARNGHATELSEAPPEAAPDYHKESLAIIGMSCEFPGAESLDQFWVNLTSGRDGAVYFTPEELDQAGLPGRLARDPSFVPVRRTIPGKNYFDPDFFKIPAKNAALMDPQFRLLLAHSWKAVEDAGYIPAELGETAVFTTVSNTFYSTARVNAESDLYDSENYVAWLMAQEGTVATMISYQLGLHGPSYAVHSNCSSSLVALHTAWQTIRLGEARCALVGAASLLPTSRIGYLFQDGMNFSSDGRCRAFDASADGMAGGEGVAVLLVKRADLAVQDGDHIYALVRGVGVNNDGFDKVGFYAPGSTGQSEVIGKVLKSTGIHPDSISYVEAHGTGTKLGDPVEVSALTQAYRQQTNRTQYCGLGSVKSNLGHLDTAAGLAGCVKVALSLRNGFIPPTLHYSAPNPGIDFANSPFYVVDKLRKWPRDQSPRRAGLSSFGIGGTNTHAILEEYISGGKPESDFPVRPVLLPLSAKDENRLTEAVRNLLDWLQARAGTVRLADVAFTLQTGRMAMPHRVAFIAKNADDLRKQLERVASRESGNVEWPEGVIAGVAREPKSKSNGEMAGGRFAKDSSDEELRRIARAWVQGAEIDWKRHHNGTLPRRVSLPTYPFARESFELGAAKPSPRQEPMAGVGVAGRLHPLVHENVSRLSSQRYLTVFSGDEFFLADHRVRGNPMLPGAAYLEMARAAVALATGTAGPTRLKNVAWLRSFSLDGSQRQLHIGLQAASPGEIQFEITATSATKGESPSTLCQGVALMGGSRESPPAAARAPQPEASAIRFTAEECYRECSRLGIEYGPSHQAILELFAGENEVLAKLALPNVVEGGLDQFVLHPSLVDGAIHASIGFHLRDQRMHGAAGPLLLPFALDVLDIHGACSSQMWAKITRSGQKPGGKHSEKLDIELCNSEGKVQFRLGGFFSRQPSPQEERSPTALSDSVFLARPAWKDRTNVPDESEPSYSAHHVVLCDFPVPIPATADSGTEQMHWSEIHSRQEDEAARFSEVAGALFRKIAGILEGKPSREILLQVVLPETDNTWSLRGLSGLLQSASLENPRLFTQLIEVAPQVSSVELQEILRRYRRSLGVAQVRHPHGKVETREIETFTPAGKTSPFPWRAAGVYLITGGAGGLGLIFARDIAKRAKGATILLAGRSEMTAELASRLEDLGPSCVYRRVDVGDRDAVEALVAEIRSEFGAIHGVIHVAGLISDNYILRKTPEDFQRVLHPKVSGVVNLDRAIGSEELDFFVVFSSLAGGLGSAGQADYAAANAFLDEFAGHRDAMIAQGTRHGRTLSIAWPLWTEGGMRVDDKIVKDVTIRTGLIPLSKEAGLAAFHSALESTESQIMVFSGDRLRIQSYLESLGERRPLDTTPPPANSQPSESAATAVLEWLRKEIASGLERPAHRLQSDEKFERYGVDSILAVQLTNRLEAFFGSLPKTLFFEHQSLKELATHLLHSYPDRARELAGVRAEAPMTLPKSFPQRELARREEKPFVAPSSDRSQPSVPGDIAIIGLAGRYPLAENLEELWENLATGRDCITEVPSERWDWRQQYSGDPKLPGNHIGKWGGFIREVDKFDPLFFNLSPKEAQLVDPQERLFLETVWNLLEGSGHTRKRLRERYQGRVAVFAASMYQQYHSFRSDTVSEALVSLSSFSGIANRVSYFFDFQGPSIAVDTMCSSAFVAIKMACDTLRNGEAALAIAGGVNLSIHPHKFTGLSAARLMGSHPGSRSFADGDGYLPAEGVGAVLLKPLAEAIKDGDPILAVIKAVTNHHSGQSGGFGVPNPQAQAQAVEECLSRSGLDPRTISYIESAANGSPLGDAIEVKALASVFGKHHQDHGVIPIGSVKSNMGHAEAASGMAQLSKVVLQMRHGQLAPNLKAGSRNPNINFESSPFRLQESLGDWPRPRLESGGREQIHARRALIHSVGAGGSTAHLIVEEYIPVDVPAEEPIIANTPALIVLSARNREQLGSQILNLRRFVEQSPNPRLVDVAYTLQVGREPMEHRAAVIVASREELLEGLDGLAEWVRTGRQTLLKFPAYVGNAEEENSSVRVLFAGASGELILREMIRRKELDKLALYWSQGGEVTWDGLYVENRPRLILLPTYPFERRVCWLPAVAGVVETPVARPAEPAPVATSAAATDEIRAFLVAQTIGLLGLRAEDLSTEKPLIKLGFNSIDAITLKSKLERAFGVEIPIAKLNAYRSLDEILVDLRAIVPENGGTPGADRPLPTSSTTFLQPEVVSRNEDRHRPFPLSEIQESFLLGRKLGAHDRAGCHVYFEIDLPGLDVFRLNAAWNRLISRHDMLRAVILPDGTQQIVEHTAPYRFRVTDLRNAGPEARAKTLSDLRDRMSHQIYDPGKWPLFEIRVALLPESGRILFSIDELIVDALSIDLLFQQWKALYTRPETALPELGLSFRDYVLAEKAFANSHRTHADLEYWVGKLRQMPPGPLLPGFNPAAGAAIQSGNRSVRLEGSLDEEKWAALKGKAESLQVSPTALLLSLFIETLRGRGREKDFSLILTFFNRRPVHPQVDQILGPFISTGIFVAGESSESGLDEEIRHTQKRLWEDLDHNNVSGIRVLRELRRRKIGPESPALPVVFTSMLGLRSGNQGSLLDNLSFSVTQTPQVSLDHQLYESAGRLHYSWDVVREHFAPGLVDSLFEEYRRWLGDLAGSPGAWDRPAGPGSVTASPETARPVLRAFPEDYGQPFPLTDQQLAYAFGRSRHGSGVASNVYFQFEAGPLDLPKIEAAWRRVVGNHPMLAITINPDGTQQFLRNVPHYPVRVQDLSAIEDVSLERTLASVEKEMAGRICPLGEWPFFELRVTLHGAASSRIHLCVDMIVADGASIDLLAQELMDACTDSGPPQTAPRVTFQDYMRHLGLLRKNEAHAQSLAYWTNKFAAIPPGPALPLTNLAPTGRTHRLSATVNGWDLIKLRASRLSVSPSTVLLTAFTQVLWHWSGERPFTVAIPCWKRPAIHPEIDRVVGDFTTMCWLAVHEMSKPFGEEAARQEQAVREDLAHAAASGLGALRKLASKNGGRDRLSFPVVFTDLSPQPPLRLPAGFRLDHTSSQTSHVRLDNMSAEMGDRLEIHWDVAQGVYSNGLAEEMFQAYHRLLGALAEGDAPWELANMMSLIAGGFPPESIAVELTAR